MKKQTLTAVLTTLLCMVGVKASAIAITNEDGVAIYYSYINNNTELSVSTSEIGYSGDIVIPESVTIDGNTFKVTNIGSYAFNSCSKLTSVRIPNSVTNISNNAFYQCTGLTSVNIPSNIMSIGNNAFYNCYKLEKVIINNLAAWCAISFENDTNCPLRYAKKLYIDEDTEIKDLVIPEGVTTIGKYSFFGCSGLTSLSIPNSITSIGEYAFQNCSGLTSVTFPNSVMSIGYGAFNYCI